MIDMSISQVYQLHNFASHEADAFHMMAVKLED